MSKKMYKFPKIGDYKNAIINVQYKSRFVEKDDDGEPIFDLEKKLPTIDYLGLVKSHGTNGGVIWTWDGNKFKYNTQIQSRKRILTPMADNLGFATFMYSKDTDILLSMIMKVHGNDSNHTPEVVRLYGEWCGGNIQKGVSINQLDKMFIIFAVKVDNKWLKHDEIREIRMPNEGIYNIMDFKTYNLTVDFNKPKNSVKEIENIISEVENSCPIGEEFGVKGVGEGVVWYPLTEGWESSRFWFKTKGEKHKSSKTKDKVPVDIEKIETINKMVESFVTTSRLNQGLDYLIEMGYEINKKNTGEYLRWLVNDVIEEELDTIIKNGFEPKDVKKSISNIARKWYFNELDSRLGL